MDMKRYTTSFDFVIDFETKSEFVPKSVILAKETRKLDSRAYFPKVSKSIDLAKAAINKKPKPAFKIFPTLTKKIFRKDFGSILLSYCFVSAVSNW